MNRSKGLFAAILPCLLAPAQTPPSARAVALVEQALAFAKENGITRLIEETNAPHGRFHAARADEPYIFIYDERGLARACGYCTEQAQGQSRWNRQDPDGVMIIQKLLRVAKNQAKGWVDYKYPNPATNLLEQKTSYFGFHDSMLIGCGIDKEAH
ncbi:MAG: cache domain-containing protein [Geothrix sp.]|jgi:cytochrome c|nr:cache domain-containing protein [Geothrix sp.]